MYRLVASWGNYSVVLVDLSRRYFSKIPEISVEIWSRETSPCSSEIYSLYFHYWIWILKKLEWKQRSFFVVSFVLTMTSTLISAEDEIVIISLNRKFFFLKNGSSSWLSGNIQATVWLMLFWMNANSYCLFFGSASLLLAAECEFCIVNKKLRNYWSILLWTSVL